MLVCLRDIKKFPSPRPSPKGRGRMIGYHHSTKTPGSPTSRLTLFPLPLGEGNGEGNLATKTPPTYKIQKCYEIPCIITRPRRSGYHRSIPKPLIDLGR